jgi:hypothetical protein
MFWILKSYHGVSNKLWTYSPMLRTVNLALNPSFWMIRAYLREARRLSSSDLAPVTTYNLLAL